MGIRGRIAARRKKVKARKKETKRRENIITRARTRARMANECYLCGGRMKKEKKLNVPTFTASLLTTGIGVWIEVDVYTCSKCGWTE